MMQIVKLKLPSNTRPKGLFLFCYGCNKYYKSDKSVTCKCQKLVYKGRVHVSGTKHGEIPKVFNTDNYIDAVKMFLEFREELKNNSYQRVPLETPIKKPSRLVECFAHYIGFLNNVNVPKHKHKERDPKYIARFDNAFEMYITALKENGINVSILNFTQVNDQMVGYVHDYFLNIKEYANKTYNNNMSLLSAFTSYIIEEFNLSYKNPFLGVPDLLVTPQPKSIRENEFERLLEIITPENGNIYKIRKGRKNPARDNIFKPWLKHAFKLALFTGGRSEDIVAPKWCDVILAEDGSFDTIKVIDHKIDKANSHRRGNTGHFYKYFAITQELGNLLLEMGYEKFKGTDKYILAPEDKLLRSTIAALISRAFSHYYKQLNTGRAIQLKDVRKTYITSALNQFGESSTALTNHATVNMSDKHYHDKDVTRQAAKETFSVFPKK